MTGSPTAIPTGSRPDDDECIHEPDTTGWDDVAELELATLPGIHWSTTAEFTATATTHHRQSWKRRSTLLNTRTSHWWNLTN